MKFLNQIKACIDNGEQVKNGKTVLTSFMNDPYYETSRLEQ